MAFINLYINPYKSVWQNMWHKVFLTSWNEKESSNKINRFYNVNLEDQWLTGMVMNRMKPKLTKDELWQKY